MQVGDLVWSLSFNINENIEKRLAIIISTRNGEYNPYLIKLVACGRQGKTSEKYLEPMETE